MSRWRAGFSGVFRLGLEHGAYCVGCCWALMLLLFAGGVMNLAVIAALTAFVAFEKLAPFGMHSARIRRRVPDGSWTLDAHALKSSPQRSPSLIQLVERSDHPLAKVRSGAGSTCLRGCSLVLVPKFT
jgi:hypothetical protein